jgi:Xaa-Pro aminopeptidase
MEIKEIQAHLVKHHLDGWLLADFHGRNNIAVDLLGLAGIVTRRSFYYIPHEGIPTALVHSIERAKFGSVPGVCITYSGYEELEKELENLLKNAARVAMEYSPMGRLPYVGLVDAGSVELVRGLGVEVVSSADLAAKFQAVLNEEQIRSHRTAARNLIEIKELAFELISTALADHRRISEYDVCQFIRQQFSLHNMETSSGPVCAVGARCGDPHYEPAERGSAAIGKNQLILIDLWAKLKGNRSAYADITWMAFPGTKNEIPKKYAEIFSVIVRARDAAVSFLRAHSGKRTVCGYEVDDICRSVVKAAGFGDHFTHRTGHSITAAEHGVGPNIDNLETEDRRELQEGHLFSIEPGIYSADYGFRTEIDVLMGHEGPEITTLPLQTEIKALF